MIFISQDNDKQRIHTRLKEIEEKCYLNGIRITAYENMLKNAEAIDYAYEQKERALSRLWAEQKALAIERCNLKDALSE